MEYVYDIVFLLIVALTVRKCARNGFVSTLLGLLEWLAALVACLLWSDAAAQWLYDSFVRARLLAAVTQNLPADLIASANAGAAAGQQALAGLTQFLSSLGGILGGAFSGMDGSGAQNVLDLMAQDGATLAQAVTDSILAPIALKLLNIVASVGIFVLVLLIFALLRRLTRARRQPRTFLGRTNRFFGGVLGLGEAFISCYLYALVLSLIAGVTGGLAWLNDALLAKTLLVSLFL